MNVDYEAVVRGALVDVWDDVDIDGTVLVSAMIDKKPVCLCSKRGEISRDAAWQAAYEWTLQRQEEIRQVEEEIEWVTECSIISPKMEQLYRDRAWEFSAEYLKRIETSKRVLSRLQSIRAELTHGMSAQPSDVQEGRDEGRR